VKACSLWEYAVAIDGWLRSQGVNSTPPPTDEEFDEVLAKYG
jgi:hypothetical protein